MNSRSYLADVIEIGQKQTAENLHKRVRNVAKEIRNDINVSIRQTKAAAIKFYKS